VVEKAATGCGRGFCLLPTTAELGSLVMVTADLGVGSFETIFDNLFFIWVAIFVKKLNKKFVNMFVYF